MKNKLLLIVYRQLILLYVYILLKTLSVVHIMYCGYFRSEYYIESKKNIEDCTDVPLPDLSSMIVSQWLQDSYEVNL